MLSGQRKLFLPIPCILVKEFLTEYTYIHIRYTYLCETNVKNCWANLFRGFGVVQFVGEACQHIKIGPRASHHIHAH